MKKILNKSLFSTILAVLLALPLSITPVAAEGATNDFATYVYQGVTVSSGNATVTDITDPTLENAVVEKAKASDLVGATYGDNNDDTAKNWGGLRDYNATFKLSNGSGDVIVKLPPGNSDRWKDLSGNYVIVSTYANGTWTPQAISIIDANQCIAVPYVDADLYMVSYIGLDVSSLNYYENLAFKYPVKTTGAALSASSTSGKFERAEGLNIPLDYDGFYLYIDALDSGNNKALNNAAAQLGLPPTQAAVFTFNTKLTAYDADKQEMTLDITPTYSVIDVTTGKQVSKDNSADVLKNSSDPIVIRFYASNFANKGDKLYVKHVKDNGKTYVYPAVVDEYNYIVFTDYNGFSSFTISKNLPAGVIATDNNGTGYTTLQDAVDSVANNGTITLADPNAALTAVVNREVTFTLAGANVKITAGNGYQLAKNGDVYTVTKTPAKATGTTNATTTKKASPKTGVVLD